MLIPCPGHRVGLRARVAKITWEDSGQTRHEVSSLEPVLSWWILAVQCVGNRIFYRWHVTKLLTKLHVTSSLVTARLTENRLLSFSCVSRFPWPNAKQLREVCNYISLIQCFIWIYQQKKTVVILSVIPLNQHQLQPYEFFPPPSRLTESAAVCVTLHCRGQQAGRPL